MREKTFSGNGCRLDSGEVEAFHPIIGFGVLRGHCDRCMERMFCDGECNCKDLKGTKIKKLIE